MRAGDSAIGLQQDAALSGEDAGTKQRRAVSLQPELGPDAGSPHPALAPDAATAHDDCRVVGVDADGEDGCAVTAAGYVYCWGLAVAGALGSAPANDRCLVGSSGQEREVPCSFKPMRVPGLSGAVDVASGGASCALLGDGRVRCWGSNQGHLLGTEVSGECDNPFTTTPSQPTRVPCSADPVLVEGIESATKLAHLGQTCALENRGEVKCWGYNYAAATVVPGTEQAIGVASSCALLADGQVRCWGSAESGRLGTAQAVGTCTGPYNQPCTTSALPVALDVASIDVSSGWQHVCAVASDGTLFCWGNNLYGQLGTPSDQSPPCDSGFPCEVLPRRVPNLSGVERVFAGVGSTCVLTTDGRALCWGNLPILDLPAAPAYQPREIPLPGRVTAVSVEGLCFVLEDGALYCAGLRYLSQSGVGALGQSGKLERVLPRCTR